MSRLHGYGVSKGSVRPTISERMPPKGRTREQIQEAYNRLEDARLAAVKSAARFIKVANLKKGDDVPWDLVKIQTQIRKLEFKMAELADDYPWLQQ